MDLLFVLNVCLCTGWGFVVCSQCVCVLVGVMLFVLNVCLCTGWGFVVCSQCVCVLVGVCGS